LPTAIAIGAIVETALTFGAGLWNDMAAVAAAIEAWRRALAGA
jgi:hypothetical protein